MKRSQWLIAKNQKPIQGRVRYWAWAVLRAVVLGVLAALIFCPSCFIYEVQNNVHVLRYYISTVFILWEVAHFISRRLNKRFDWHQQSRAIIGGHLRFILLLFLPFNAIYIYVRFRITAANPELFGKWDLYELYLTNFILFIIFIFWFNAFTLFKSWKKSRERNKELEKQRLTYQLMALKNQINPHFLFNNLNTLSQIVKQDPDLAEDFIDQLSKVYRYLLQQKEKDLVPIKEELKFLDSFLFLIRIRFSEQIKLDIKEDGLQHFLVAPIVLQLLIENAIKHNEASREFPLSIYLYRENDFLVVKNTVRPKGSVAYSSGTGLSNIQERYELLSNKAVEIIEDAQHFEVRIPIILNEKNQGKKRERIKAMEQ